MDKDYDTKTDDPKGDEAPEFPVGVHPDLAWLISMANGQETSMNSPVTLWVKGTQFSGQVASAREGSVWFIKLWTDKVRDATVAGASAEVNAATRRAIRESVDKYAPIMLEQQADGPPPKRFGFLTLKAARVWTPGAQKPSHVDMIRIRLDQIDAFTLGSPSED